MAVSIRKPFDANLVEAGIAKVIKTMTQHRLGSFIQHNMEPILQAWEDFARTIEPPALTMDDTELRDHARQMLQAFAADLATSQTEPERVAKSKGLGKRGRTTPPPKRMPKHACCRAIPWCSWFPNTAPCARAC
jgi:hypothetical protein